MYRGRVNHCMCSESSLSCYWGTCEIENWNWKLKKKLYTCTCNCSSSKLRFENVLWYFKWPTVIQMSGRMCELSVTCVCFCSGVFFHLKPQWSLIHRQHQNPVWFHHSWHLHKFVPTVSRKCKAFVYYWTKPIGEACLFLKNILP